MLRRLADLERLFAQLGGHCDGHLPVDHGVRHAVLGVPDDVVLVLDGGHDDEVLREVPLEFERVRDDELVFPAVQLLVKQLVDLLQDFLGWTRVAFG